MPFIMFDKNWIPDNFTHKVTQKNVSILWPTKKIFGSALFSI